MSIGDVSAVGLIGSPAPLVLVVMAVMTGVRPDESRQRDGAATSGRRSPGRSGRPIDGLFDVELVLAPDGGLAVPERPGTSLTAAELVEEVFGLECIVITDPLAGTPLVVPRVRRYCARAAPRMLAEIVI